MCASTAATRQGRGTEAHATFRISRRVPSHRSGGYAHSRGPGSTRIWRASRKFFPSPLTVEAILDRLSDSTTLTNMRTRSPSWLGSADASQNDVGTPRSRRPRGVDAQNVSKSDRDRESGAVICHSPDASTVALPVTVDPRPHGGPVRRDRTGPAWPVWPASRHYAPDQETPDRTSVRFASTPISAVIRSAMFGITSRPLPDGSPLNSVFTLAASVGDPNPPSTSTDRCSITCSTQRGEDRRLSTRDRLWVG